MGVTESQVNFREFHSVWSVVTLNVATGHYQYITRIAPVTMLIFCNYFVYIIKKILDALKEGKI